MQIRALSTFTDWTAVAGCWGKPGVYRIFEHLRIAGIRDVYWRVFNGGMAMYPSRVATIQEPNAYPDSIAARAARLGVAKSWFATIDFRDYDPIPEALEAAEEFGINLHFWYTIYEEDHGGPFLSAFAREHPEYWHTDREGQRYQGTLEFFHEPVRDYKLRIVDELLAYKPKGLLLDFVRHNAKPSADITGVHRFGYSPEVIAAYKQRFGDDPMALPADDEQWLSFKREILTDFVREIGRRFERSVPGGEFGTLVWPVDNPTWLCLDLPALTAEGTLGLVAVQSLKYLFDAQEVESQDRIVRPQVRSEQVAVAPSITAYNGVTRRQIGAIAERAESLGYKDLMLFEADALAKWRAGAAVRAVNLGRADHQRRLEATAQSATSLAQVDWVGVPVHDDFLPLDPVGERDGRDATRIQFVYTETALAIRFEAEGFDPEEMAPPSLEDHPQGYFLAGLGARHNGFIVQAFCAFLDPEVSRETFLQFSLTPEGCRNADAYGSADRKVSWDAQSSVEGDVWRGALWIPYEALDTRAPRKGERWAANFVRGLGRTRGALSWSVTASAQIVPDELSDLWFV